MLDFGDYFHHPDGRFVGSSVLGTASLSIDGAPSSAGLRMVSTDRQADGPAPRRLSSTSQLLGGHVVHLNAGCGAGDGLTWTGGATNVTWAASGPSQQACFSPAVTLSQPGTGGPPQPRVARSFVAKPQLSRASACSTATVATSDTLSPPVSREGLTGAALVATGSVSSSDLQGVVRAGYPSPSQSPHQQLHHLAADAAFGDTSDGVDEDCATVFFGNVLRTAKEEEVFQIFSHFGTVVTVVLFRAYKRQKGCGRGCGLVTMATRDEACAAIAGLHDVHTFDGMKKPMVVRWMDKALQQQRNAESVAAAAAHASAAAAAPPQAVSVPSSAGVLRGCEPDAIKLFVGNIPSFYNEASLLPVFGCFGDVVELAVTRDRSGLSKGSAFVWFATRAQAELCMQLCSQGLVLPDPTRPPGMPARPLAVSPAAAVRRNSLQLARVPQGAGGAGHCGDGGARGAPLGSTGMLSLALSQQRARQGSDAADMAAWGNVLCHSMPGLAQQQQQQRHQHRSSGPHSGPVLGSFSSMDAASCPQASPLLGGGCGSTGDAATQGGLARSLTQPQHDPDWLSMIAMQAALPSSMDHMYHGGGGASGYGSQPAVLPRSGPVGSLGCLSWPMDQLGSPMSCSAGLQGHSQLQQQQHQHTLDSLSLLAMCGALQN